MSVNHHIPKYIYHTYTSLINNDSALYVKTTNY